MILWYQPQVGAGHLLDDLAEFPIEGLGVAARLGKDEASLVHVLLQHLFFRGLEARGLMAVEVGDR